MQHQIVHAPPTTNAVRADMCIDSLEGDSSNNHVSTRNDGGSTCGGVTGPPPHAFPANVVPDVEVGSRVSEELHGFAALVCAIESGLLFTNVANLSQGAPLGQPAAWIKAQTPRSRVGVEFVRKDR